MGSSLVFSRNAPLYASRSKKKIVPLSERERRIDSLAKMIREGSDYKWKSQIERKIWTDVAKDIIKEHISGKKTIVSEACFRAHFNKSDVVLVESRILLNEGLFGALGDMLGGGLAKTFGKAFGGVKSRNWWIFGGGGEKETEKYRQAYIDATEKGQEVFAKLGENTLNNLIKQLKDAMPEFPNGGSGKDFTDAMAKFTQYYEMIRTAAGAPTTDGQKPPEGTPPKLGVDDANDIIKKMRKTIEFFDRDLKDRYTVNLESRTRHVPPLVEVLFNEAKDESEIGDEGRMTDSMKYLKSNLAPMVLGALGLSAIAAGTFVQSQFFKDLTTVVTKHVVTTPGSPAIPPVEVEKILGGVTRDNGGRGLIAYLNKMVPGANLKFSDPPEKLLKVAGQLVGDPSAAGGVKAFAAMHDSGVLGKGVKGVNAAFQHLAQHLGEKGQPTSIAGMLKTFGTGTHKVAGDMLQLDVGTIKTKVIETAGKAAVEATSKTTTTAAQSALGAKLTALGPMGVAVGVGLVASAVSIKALRSYGAKNSRSTYLQAALDLFKDIKPDEVPEKEIPAEPPYTPPPAVAGKVTVEIDSKVVKVVAPKEVVASGGFEIRPSFTVEDVPIGDKDKAKVGVVEYLDSPAGKNSVPMATGAKAEDVAKLEFEVKDNRKEKKEKGGGEVKPGTGRPAVISIKDHTIFPLLPYLFEDADLRIVGTDAAKKSATIKNLKKKFKDKPESMPLPTTSTVEKNVMKNYLKAKDTDFELKAAPGDKGVQGGLDALRKKLKTGNAILTFSTTTVEKLAKSFGIKDDEKRKQLLKIYSKDPSSAPPTTAKYNAFIKANVPEKKRKEFIKYLVDLGIAKKAAPPPGGKSSKKSTKKKEGMEEARTFDENVLIERWQQLSGLLQG